MTDAGIWFARLSADLDCGLNDGDGDGGWQVVVGRELRASGRGQRASRGNSDRREAKPGCLHDVSPNVVRRFICRTPLSGTTANGVDLTISPTLLATADEMIE